jgi:ActD protein
MQAYTTPAAKPLFGLMAEFDSADALVDGARRMYAAGYRKLDTYSPFPIEPAWEAIGAHDTTLQKLVLGGGIAGCLGGFGLCYWVSVIAYPLNIGGRPFNSWPSFIPVTFETTILLASLTAVAGMILLNGLPMPYHPVFNVKRFSLASSESFFLTVEADDPKFDRHRTLEFMRGIGAREINEVEP